MDINLYDLINIIGVGSHLNIYAIRENDTLDLLFSGDEIGVISAVNLSKWNVRNISLRDDQLNIMVEDC